MTGKMVPVIDLEDVVVAVFPSNLNYCAPAFNNFVAALKICTYH